MSTQQSSEAYSSIDNNLFTQPIPEDQTENFTDDNYCENCLRKQSQYLIKNYGDQYKIEFTNRRSSEIKKGKNSDALLQVLLILDHFGYADNVTIF